MGSPRADIVAERDQDTDAKTGQQGEQDFLHVQIGTVRIKIGQDIFF